MIYEATVACYYSRFALPHKLQANPKERVLTHSSLTHSILFIRQEWVIPFMLLFAMFRNYCYYTSRYTHAQHGMIALWGSPTLPCSTSSFCCCLIKEMQWKLFANYVFLDYVEDLTPPWALFVVSVVMIHSVSAWSDIYQVLFCSCGWHLCVVIWVCM